VRLFDFLRHRLLFLLILFIEKVLIAWFQLTKFKCQQSAGVSDPRQILFTWALLFFSQLHFAHRAHLDLSGGGGGVS
jgi:hypothetical protein